MKKALAALLPLVLLSAAACTSSGAGKGAAPSSAEAARPSPEDEEKATRQLESIRAIQGLSPERADSDAADAEEWVVFTDEETGRRLQRVPKLPTLKVENGQLRHMQLNPNMASLPLVREDEKYYYVEAPADRERKAPDAGGAEKPPEDLLPIVEIDPLEGEAVSPPVSRIRLRLEERSEGLPTSGFWRSHVVVADLDGNGSPEILAPPPRLSATTFQIFRYDGARWTAAIPDLYAVEEGLQLSFGGVDVADLDADGRLDILSIGHGAGPTIAFNEGRLRFRHEARGLPQQMVGRAIAAGDIDGDGFPDVLAVSDIPEATEEREKRERGEAPARVRQAPAPAEEDGGYRKGFNVRAFFGTKDGVFTESTAGLEDACYGYALALSPRPADGGAPFFATGCRYIGWTNLLYEWDAAARAFRRAGRGIVELYSVHTGAALGTYRGFPAAFVSYLKTNAPVVLEKPIRGQGVSVYYREGGEWKRKRVVKDLADRPAESAGVGVGDLNGDGLDDVVWADDATGRLRVFFQTREGGFEELDPALQPRHYNYSMSVKVVDVDGDGRNDIVLMYEFRTSTPTRAGGLRFFRNAG